jgi:hypothetical protein
VWQAKDLRDAVFGSVAIIRLTGGFSEVWQGKEISENVGKPMGNEVKS